MKKTTELEQIFDLYEDTLEAQKKFTSNAPQFPLIFAVFGHPTAPLDPKIQEGIALYWKKQGSLAVQYGDPKGEPEYRKMMTEALNRQYRTEHFTHDDILFTVGGLEGLHNIFYALRKTGKEKIVTPVPYYPVYSGFRDVDLPCSDLHLINCMRPPYALTNTFLQESLQTIHQEDIGAFLFCDPNNPLGTTPGFQEWQKIAKTLRCYPNTLIVLDEAYYELNFTGSHISLLHAAPDLIDRIVLLRSATKGMSAAGERMAITVCKDPTFMEKMLQNSMVEHLHSPKSSQFAYAWAMHHLNEQALANLVNWYRPKVERVKQILQKTGLDQNLPIPTDSTFYVIANFSCLIGKQMHKKACAVRKREVIEADLDIAYHLLYEYGLAFCPLSFFGIDPTLGYLRITCSQQEEEMDILEERLNKLIS